VYNHSPTVQWHHVLFSSWAFCFYGRHDEKHKAPHSPKVALIFLSHVKFTCSCFTQIGLCIWLLSHVPLFWSFTHPQAFTLLVKALGEISSGIWKAPYLSMKQGSLFVFVLFYLLTLRSFKSQCFIPPSTSCCALGIFKKALDA
jgi:hypothetical protein